LAKDVPQLQTLNLESNIIGAEGAKAVKEQSNGRLAVV
jgi:hypothetical protein